MESGTNRSIHTGKENESAGGRLKPAGDFTLARSGHIPVQLLSRSLNGLSNV
jgi:hypothetical protein